MLVQDHLEELIQLLIPVHFPGFVPLTLVIDVYDVSDVVRWIPVEFIFDQLSLETSASPVGHVGLKIILFFLLGE